MSSKKIIENIYSRIRQLESRSDGEIWIESQIDGLHEAIRIINSLEETKNIDWTLQTR